MNLELSRQVLEIRDRFTVAQPDKTGTPWAVLTAAAEAISPPAQNTGPAQTLKDQIASLVSGKGPTIASLRTADQIMALIIPPDFDGRLQGILATLRQMDAHMDEGQLGHAATRDLVKLAARLCYQLGADEPPWNEPVRLPREDWLAQHAEPILDVLGAARWGISQLNADNAGRQNRDYARCDAIEEIVRLFVAKVRRRKVEEATLFLAGWLSAGDSVGFSFAANAAHGMTAAEAYQAFRRGERPVDPEGFGAAVGEFIKALDQ